MEGSVRAHASRDSSGISFSLVICKLSFYCLRVFLCRYPNKLRRHSAVMAHYTQKSAFSVCTAASSIFHHSKITKASFCYSVISFHAVRNIHAWCDGDAPASKLCCKRIRHWGGTVIEDSNTTPTGPNPNGEAAQHQSKPCAAGNGGNRADQGSQLRGRECYLEPRPPFTTLSDDSR